MYSDSPAADDGDDGDDGHREDTEHLDGTVPPSPLLPPPHRNSLEPFLFSGTFALSMPPPHWLRTLVTSPLVGVVGDVRSVPPQRDGLASGFCLTAVLLAEPLMS